MLTGAYMPAPPVVAVAANLPAFSFSHEIALGVLVVAVAATLAGWWVATRRYRAAAQQLGHVLEIAAQRQLERDSAQEELAKRLVEERELGREKAQFQAQLAEYEKYAALAQLAMGAAHEINNPLLGIFSHLELELRVTKDEDQRLEIQQCIQGAKRISATLHGLLNYARPGPLLISKIHLDRLVNDTLAFLRHQPLFRGIQLLTDIPADLPQISADANQLSQVLMNLLLNAGQASAEGGRITVSAHKVKFAEDIELAVSDTGCGIPADLLSRVTEPFFTTKRGQGTGLGLSISQAYVRSHKGDLRIESIPGQGTTVRITLPIRQVGRPAPEFEEVVT